MKTLTYDNLNVTILPTRAEMGHIAAQEAADCIKKLLNHKAYVRCVFAAAPSQNEFLSSLLASSDIEWSRIDAFHMDEYIGLEKNDNRSFAGFLNNAIFNHVPFRSVNLLDGTASVLKECTRYASLLNEEAIDIVFMGIGENGHIAFNDPPVADFNDAETVKLVQLEHACIEQQVHDGCFKSIDEVPTHAFTLTIPTLVNAEHIFCMVPGALKATAVFNTLTAPISCNCPASILRTKASAKLYLDSDSAALLGV